MVRRISGRPSWLFTVALIASLMAAVPAFAQSTGMVKGVVNDDKGQPVADAKVTIEMTGGTGRKFETKTNKKGEYIQIGLASGAYKVTAEKDKLGSAPATVHGPRQHDAGSEPDAGDGERGGDAGSAGQERGDHEGVRRGRAVEQRRPAR